MNPQRFFGLDWRISLAQECWFYFRVCRNWRQVVRARMRSTFLDRIETRQGAVIAFAVTPPWQIFQEIWRYQVYTRGYPHKWPSPHTIVDIGANVGIFSLYAAQRWKNAVIYAYEPSPDNAKWFQENIHRSGNPRIHLKPVAIAGVADRLPFYLKRESGWHSLVAGEGVESEITVETETLEDVLADVKSDVLDLVKIDCEGGEYDLLNRREELLAKHVRCLTMEYHENARHTVSDLTAMLQSAGFAYRYYPEPRWKTGLLYAWNPKLEK